MKKVELLSPAGNFDALKGAVNAGADAVYLGGERYGARAYADNFTTEEICEGIHYAHLFGRKIYLTVNTLVKEKELDGLYHFVLPFYEKGLDGVIIQDLGVLRFLRKYFPQLALHASTQMTITGAKGAALAREEGISRIVPARELSLDELVLLGGESGVEIEAFIHGAMCYCYSGQCLFSSLLGGRSGNRGRCAQPCRLPYRIDEEGSRHQPFPAPDKKQVCYPLSMKDMCTIDLIPELIEAGIRSFKIEGRMKNPAYTAGVTALYRKYIDQYYQDKKNYQVTARDRKLLSSLYIRSETGDGYYHRKNGREMISLSSPAYSPTDEALLASIRQKYIDTPLCHTARAKVCLKAGEPAQLALEMSLGQRELKVQIQGEQVQTALKQPLTKEKIKEQIQKSSNLLIRIDQVCIEEAENIFMPIRALNELRRKAIATLEESVLHAQAAEAEIAVSGRQALLWEPFRPSLSENLTFFMPSVNAGNRHNSGTLHVSVLTPEQLEAALSEEIGRIYIDYGLLDILGDTVANGRELYGVTPYVVREKDKIYLEKIQELLSSGVLKGVLVRNLESAAFFANNISTGQIVLDTNLYIWNREALGFWEGRAGEFYLPLECNSREWKELLNACPERKPKASAILYGRLPMMVTANCVKKNKEKCGKKRGITLMEDRYGKQFPVYSDCLCCYNVIYNSVPLSLHRPLSQSFQDKSWKDKSNLDKSILGWGEGLLVEVLSSGGNYRLDFTLEEAEEARQIIRFFHRLVFCNDKEAADPRDQLSFLKEYTTGHYKRGVE